MTVLEKIKRCVELVWDFEEIYDWSDIEAFCGAELGTYPQHDEILDYFKQIEELEKEAEEWLDKKYLKDMGVRKPCKQAYLAGAEPRERQIAELEDKLANADYQLEGRDIKIKDLEKENAELKDYRLNTVAKQQTEMSKYALNLEHKLSWYDDQLTKAKELLERLLITSCNSDVLNLLPNCSEVLRVRVEAEQFLSEVEK